MRYLTKDEILDSFSSTTIAAVVIDDASMDDEAFTLDQDGTVTTPCAPVECKLDDLENVIDMLRKAGR